MASGKRNRARRKPKPPKTEGTGNITIEIGCGSVPSAVDFSKPGEYHFVDPRRQAINSAVDAFIKTHGWRGITRRQVGKSTLLEAKGGQRVFFHPLGFQEADLPPRVHRIVFHNFMGADADTDGAMRFASRRLVRNGEVIVAETTTPDGYWVNQGFRAMTTEILQRQSQIPDPNGLLNRLKKHATTGNLKGDSQKSIWLLREHLEGHGFTHVSTSRMPQAEAILRKMFEGNQVYRRGSILRTLQEISNRKAIDRWFVMRFKK